MASLRNFLKQAPVPALLKAEYEDGGEKTVRMGESRSRYRDAELALRGALTVEAVDADGNTLRVWEADDAQEREAAAAVSAPATPAGVDNMAMITQVARLLQEASDAAAARHAEAFQLAYQQQALLVNVMSERLAQLEHVWQDTLIQRGEELSEAEAEAAAAAPGPNPNDQLVSGLLQAAVMKMSTAEGKS